MTVGHRRHADRASTTRRSRPWSPSRSRSHRRRPTSRPTATYTYTVHGPDRRPGRQAARRRSPARSPSTTRPPPHVIGTTVNGRVVTVQFRQADAPATINPTRVFVALTDAQGNILSEPQQRPAVQAHRTTRRRTPSTLDYSGARPDASSRRATTRSSSAAATSGPTGRSSRASPTSSGNKLDGKFNGVFPRATTRRSRAPATPFTDRNFVEFLGFQTLTAPVVTSLQLTPATDTGIQGDENTNVNRPVFVGQVADELPRQRPGRDGPGRVQRPARRQPRPRPGRTAAASTGPFDVQVDDRRQRHVHDPGPPAVPARGVPARPAGRRSASPTAPPLPGLSSQFDHAFRIDKTAADDRLGDARAGHPGAATRCRWAAAQRRLVAVDPLARRRRPGQPGHRPARDPAVRSSSRRSTRRRRTTSATTR